MSIFIMSFLQMYYYYDLVIITHRLRVKNYVFMYV